MNSVTGENVKVERVNRATETSKKPLHFYTDKLKEKKCINNQPSHIKLNDGFYTSVYCLLACPGGLNYRLINKSMNEIQ